jgi:ubiquitin carboxyl-terminal hydrolase 4/11
LHEQIKTIQTLLKAFNETPIQVGDVAYIVSRAWVNKALAMGGDPKHPKKEMVGELLGPVDNEDIIGEIIKNAGVDDFVRLKPGTQMPDDFELFPKDAWDLVVDWYGVKESQPPIVRKAGNSALEPGGYPNITFEVHPPVFKIHRLWSEVSPIPIEQSTKTRNPPPLVMARSRLDDMQPFLKEIKDRLHIPTPRKVRLWRVPRKLPGADLARPKNALTPPDSPGREADSNNPQDSWTHLLLDVPSFSGMSTNDRIKVEMNDETGNSHFSASAKLAHYELTDDQTLVVDEEAENGLWVLTYSPKFAGKDNTIASRGSGTNLVAQTRATTSGRSSPAPQGPMTRGRAQQKKLGRAVGAAGLQNLGNTCYMNSALQCVRSVEELTKYFLTGEYEKEINRSNPLGFKGQVAMAYGDLLRAMYDPGRSNVTPREFKSVVGRCRPTFSGWGQQDSQEFFGFLIDGLQEDLSRVKVKPYIEKPDSTDDMIGNPEKIRAMAEQVWNITKKRDDSVVADLFTGMYQSTLKCPVCYKISITFDPFTNLTLPLPVEDMWSRPIKFFPLNDVPVQFECELPKHSAIELLKHYVSERTGVPAERLFGAEEFKDKFFKIYEDSGDVSDEIQSNDIATFHELESSPTNWPPRPLKYRSMLDIDGDPWVDPRTERMAVSVLHRRRVANRSRNMYGGGSLHLREENVTPPHFIVVTPEEVGLINKVLLYFWLTRVRTGSERGHHPPQDSREGCHFLNLACFRKQ